MTTQNLTRNYDSDFSATLVKDILNSIARERGNTDLETPVKSAKPSRPKRDEFTLALRTTEDNWAQELFGSRISRDGIEATILGHDKDNNDVRVEFKRA